MSNQQTPITEDRLKEIEERLGNATPGPVIAEGIGGKELLRPAPQGYPWVMGDMPRLLDVGCAGTEPWGQFRRKEDAELAASAWTDTPDLVAEIRRQRAKLQEQESQLAASQRTNLQARRKFMDAIAHPEQYTKLRAQLLANEAVFEEADRTMRNTPGAPTDGNQGEGA